MAIPFQLPVFWKRRLTPANVAIAARMVASGIPASLAAAMAAKAFKALCCPGIGIKQRRLTLDAHRAQHEIGSGVRAVGEQAPAIAPQFETLKHLGQYRVVE